MKKAATPAVTAYKSGNRSNFDIMNRILDLPVTSTGDFTRLLNRLILY
jgi:hypothetical protein